MSKHLYTARYVETGDKLHDANATPCVHCSSLAYEFCCGIVCLNTWHTILFSDYSFGI